MASPRASNAFTLLLAVAAAALLAAAPAAASGPPPGPCKPLCRAGRTWDAHDCPWKHCGHAPCTYKNKAGTWVKGHRCVPRAAAKPSPSPSPKPMQKPKPMPMQKTEPKKPAPKKPAPKKPCPNKCFLKWRAANAGCDHALCRVRGCPLTHEGRKQWGFRCVRKDTSKPSPSPSPSPEPQYPPYCPLQCRRWKGAVQALCNPARCVVRECTPGNKAWKTGYNCVPLRPTPSPTPTPSRTPSPSPSPSPSPAPPVRCAARCAKHRWLAVRGCDARHCVVARCKLSWWWKRGYVCRARTVAPRPHPVPVPRPRPVARCANKCLWSLRRAQVRLACDPVHCKIVSCWPWRALKCVDKHRW